MCKTHNLSHCGAVILDVAQAMQLAVAGLPEFPPLPRIGIRECHLILPQAGDLHMSAGASA